MNIKIKKCDDFELPSGEWNMIDGGDYWLLFGVDDSNHIFLKLRYDAEPLKDGEVMCIEDEYVSDVRKYLMLRKTVMPNVYQQSWSTSQLGQWQNQQMAQQQAMVQSALYGSGLPGI